MSNEIEMHSNFPMAASAAPKTFALVMAVLE
jgi:hypothetical protein